MSPALRWRARRTALAVALAALAVYGGLFAVHAAAMVRFPYQTDYGEGPLLSQARQIASGHDPYHSDARPPYTVANYTPVYPLLVAALQRLTSARGFGPSRALSGAATLVAAALAAATAHTLLRRAGRSGWTAAAIPPLSAGLLLCQPDIWLWGPLGRVDALALAWSMAGIYAVARRPLRADRAWPWFLLAVLTRQSSIEGLAAAIWYLWPQGRAVAIRLGLRWAGALAVGVAALQLLTAGRFLQQIVLANVNTWTPAAALLGWLGWLFLNGGLPLLAGAAWGWRLTRDLPDGRLLRGFAVSAWIVSLTVGKVGSSVNYFFPTIAACSLLAALIPLSPRRAGLAAAALVAYAVGLGPVADGHGVAAAAVRTLTAYRDPRTPGYNRLGWRVPADGRDPAQRRLVALLRATPGPILSENMGDLLLAGHRIFFQPFEMTQLYRAGRWNDAPLVRRAQTGGFGLVVLYFPLRDPAAWATDRWPRNLLSALAVHYRPAGRIGRFYLYRYRPV